jgi:hypothetical protein
MTLPVASQHRVHKINCATSRPIPPFLRTKRLRWQRSRQLVRFCRVVHPMLRNDPVQFSLRLLSFDAVLLVCHSRVRELMFGSLVVLRMQFCFVLDAINLRCRRGKPPFLSTSHHSKENTHQSYDAQRYANAQTYSKVFAERCWP